MSAPDIFISYSREDRSAARHFAVAITGDPQSGADLVAIHAFGGWGVSAGVTVIADGTDQAAERLLRVVVGDTGIGVLRHADAGYDIAIERAAETGLTRTLSDLNAGDKA